VDGFFLARSKARERVACHIPLYQDIANFSYFRQGHITAVQKDTITLSAELFFEAPLIFL